jgi:uncharacterized protein YdeI (YjbR/CyaY-like superfamily)
MNTASKATRPVDGYIRKNARWSAEMQALRTIVLDTPLVEEMKWRTPCYSFEGHNVVMIGCLKECCTLSFMKGSLLKDTKLILEQPGENTRAARVIRFESVSQIDKLASTLKKYIVEAIELEKSGKKYDFAGDAEPTMPQELEQMLQDDADLSRAFAALTPGRRRWYILFFASAKQSKTRTARIEKYREQILAGKGMHDD